MPVSIYFFILLELLVVSYGDIRSRKVPNIWSILNIFIFIIFLFLFSDIYQLKFETFFYSLVFLVVGFILFLLKIMGGGDVKYLFSVYLLIPVEVQEKALESLLLSTVLIGSFFLITNTIKNYKDISETIKEGRFEHLRMYFGKKFSFVPVIMISWIWLGWKITIL